MSLSPLAYADSLRIGTIDFVSPDEIKVLLDIEAPDGVALNTGTPRPFPRINGYVLIPSDDGHLVAQVEWITIERSQYPKRKGMQDFGLVDLPYPLRKMSLNPLGVLAYESKDAKGNDVYRFRRGVESYPTVGDAVLLPTQNQLRAIVGVLRGDLYGTRVGRLTSGGWSAGFGKSIGMGYVRPDLAEPGTKLKVRMFREFYDAVVTEDSPFDPSNARIRVDG